jgi:hypothetical protein
MFSQQDEKTQLEKLKELYEAGFITEVEYRRRRQDLLLTSGRI